jgi:hypothetical protein
MLKQKGIENTDSIGVANFARTGPFGVWHHAKYIPFLVANSCNVMQRTVGVGFGPDVAIFITVPVNDLIVIHDGLDGGFIGLETSFAVGDRNLKRPVLFSYDMNILANELLVGVFEQNTRQQA